MNLKACVWTLGCIRQLISGLFSFSKLSLLSWEEYVNVCKLTFLYAKPHHIPHLEWTDQEVSCMVCMNIKYLTIQGPYKSITSNPLAWQCISEVWYYWCNTLCDISESLYQVLKKPICTNCTLCFSKCSEITKRFADKRKKKEGVTECGVFSRALLLLPACVVSWSWSTGWEDAYPVSHHHAHSHFPFRLPTGQLLHEGWHI